jgi:hypothetical protein
MQNSLGAPPCAQAIRECAGRIESAASEIVGSARLRLMDEVVMLRRIARSADAPPDPIIVAVAERRETIASPPAQPLQRRQRSRR